MNTGLPTALLASGLLRAGGGAVDNPCSTASTTRSRSTYLSPDRVRTSGATSLEEQVLDPAVHDREGFDCGVPALSQYLQRYAEQHRRKGISASYVLVDSAAVSIVLGYYALSSAEVDVAQLADAERRRLPRCPVPCIRMGRLACRIDRRGSGLGNLLVGCAVDRCLKAREQVAALCAHRRCEG